MTYINDFSIFSIMVKRAMVTIAWAGLCLAIFTDQANADEYHVAIGDTVSVNVFGHEDLSGECEVDGAGRCSLPLIKFVDAAGLTVMQLEQVILKQLKPDYLKDPQIQVEVIGYRPVYVLGEVRNPGSYPYSVGMTVVAAVALAGGYTYRAARRKITVIRADHIDSGKERIEEHGNMDPGDVIEIPERFF